MNDIHWPRKYNLVGVKVSATTYSESLALVLHAAKTGIPASVTHLAVHGLMLANRDDGIRAMLEAFQIVAPDGMPLRVALNRIHQTRLPDRVYGPQLMQMICASSAQEGIGVYLYGSHLYVVNSLEQRLLRQHPGLKIVGRQPSAFRPLSREEDERLVAQVNESGAGILFLGLGCPLQERFAYEHRTTIKAVQVCVGAAFDFHSGNKRMAPSWMQQHSLEWLFRLSQEPRRLWRRYLLLNTAFLCKFLLQWSRVKRYDGEQRQLRRDS
jgi:N-acetylglucosaminyldiphosphoundecaprenol N-acetyl-beta-D-mannosaminyltransferase